MKSRSERIDGILKLVYKIKGLDLSEKKSPAFEITEAYLINEFMQDLENSNSLKSVKLKYSKNVPKLYLKLNCTYYFQADRLKSIADKIVGNIALPSEDMEFVVKEFQFKPLWE